MNILIMGASGSGQTTLGQALAAQLDYVFIDTDDFFWVPTTPPYQCKRTESDRLQLILQGMQGKNVVVAGSIMGWGDSLELCFDLIVFLSLDTATRIRRLRQREMAELGAVDESFIDWASEYENPAFNGRNRQKHEQWLARQSCPIVTIDGDTGVEYRLQQVYLALATIKPQDADILGPYTGKCQRTV